MRGSTWVASKLTQVNMAHPSMKKKTSKHHPRVGRSGRPVVSLYVTVALGQSSSSSSTTFFLLLPLLTLRRDLLLLFWRPLPLEENGQRFFLDGDFEADEPTEP
mmetsp:Transcript_18647/g.33633  ORF Transcript_18647/g.33633 Transcript_18647/m.33633 type:complete len:104 (-) Transcript_18647:107-418(-)